MNANAAIPYANTLPYGGVELFGGHAWFEVSGLATNAPGESAPKVDDEEDED